ncbi:MAG: hypothetical protein GX542_02255 [Rhodococcus sp.]|nr:hypothetical protein [Rhodococcus sp. (in: high G+C Gram-positive bacteria)]
MRVLIIGRGPVAQMCARALTDTAAHQVICGVRGAVGGSEFTTTRLVTLSRRTTQPKTLNVDQLLLADAGTEWDAVLCTAAVTEPGIGDFIASLPSTAMVLAVSQVPSEVAALQLLAG